MNRLLRGIVLATVFCLVFVVGVDKAFAVYNVFIGNEVSKDVSVMSYDGTSLSLLKKIPMGGNPYEVVLSPDNSRLYVACANADTKQGEIDIYDARTFEHIGELPVADSQGKGSPFSLVITKDGKKLYASNRQDSRVYVYDLVNMRLSKTIDLRLEGNAEWAIRFLILSEDGKYLFVTGQGNAALYGVRTDTDTQEFAIGNVPVPRGMAVRGNKLFLTNEKPSAVTVFDIDTKKVDRVISIDVSLGDGPQTMTLSTDKKYMYVALAFGRLIAFDVDPNSSKYLSIVAMSVPTSSQYHYGVMVIGDTVFITNQADRGIAPNSIEAYKHNANNFSLLDLVKTTPTGGVGPYLMTNFLLPSRTIVSRPPSPPRQIGGRGILLVP